MERHPRHGTRNGLLHSREAACWMGELHEPCIAGPHDRLLVSGGPAGAEAPPAPGAGAPFPRSVQFRRRCCRAPAAGRDCSTSS